MGDSTPLRMKSAGAVRPLLFFETDVLPKRAFRSGKSMKSGLFTLYFRNAVHAYG